MSLDFSFLNSSVSEDVVSILHYINVDDPCQKGTMRPKVIYMYNAKTFPCLQLKIYLIKQNLYNPKKTHYVDTFSYR